MRKDPHGIASVSVRGQIRGHHLFMISNEPRSEVCRITYRINKMASLKMRGKDLNYVKKHTNAFFTAREFCLSRVFHISYTTRKKTALIKSTNRGNAFFMTSYMKRLHIHMHVP